MPYNPFGTPHSTVDAFHNRLTPFCGSDDSGDFVDFPTSDVLTQGALLRRMKSGEFHGKIWVGDPNKPSVYLLVLPNGQPSLQLYDPTTGQTVTLTVATLLALTNPIPTPAPAPVVNTPKIPT